MEIIVTTTKAKGNSVLEQSLLGAHDPFNSSRRTLKYS